MAVWPFRDTRPERETREQDIGTKTTPSVARKLNTTDSPTRSVEYSLTSSFAWRTIDVYVENPYRNGPRKSTRVRRRVGLCFGRGIRRHAVFTVLHRVHFWPAANAHGFVRRRRREGEKNLNNNFFKYALKKFPARDGRCTLNGPNGVS